MINVLVFLFLQGPSFSLSSGQEVDTKPIVEYGAIPYRITHPGKECVLAVPGTPAGAAGRARGPPSYPGGACRPDPPVEKIPSRPPSSRSSRRCSCTAAGCTSSSTCCSCGSSGTTSRTAWAGSGTPSSICSAGSWPALTQVAVSPDSTDSARGGERRDRRGAGRLCAAVSARAGADAVFVFFIFLVEIPALRDARASGSSSSSCRRSGSSRRPTSGAQGGVAYFAHIGGFLFGLALIKLFAQRRSAAYVGRRTASIRSTEVASCSRPRW